MKLFQKLLIPSAVFSFLPPLSGTTNELNLAEIYGYSSSEEVQNNSEFSNFKVSRENSYNLEPIANNFEAGSFSETTTMSGSASFQIGAVDGSEITEKVTATYSYDIDLNTTFTGDDNLYVGIETGNSSAFIDFTLDSSGDGGDTLNVTSLYYQFPLGSYEVAVGAELDADDLMPTTTSKYSDSFFFGSKYGLASNYFANQGTGAGFAVAKTFNNGFNASGSIIGTGASTSGILTDAGIDVLTFSLGYDADNYGGGIIYQKSDSLCTLYGNYVTDICNAWGITTLLDEGYSTTTIGAYYSPGDKTTLSATTSIQDASVTGLDIDLLTDFQFAVDRELGNGTLSASWKTFPFYRIPKVGEAKSDDLGSFFELYYTYNVNDSLEITPGISFAMPYQDAADIAAGSDVLAYYLYDRTAIGIGATFKF